FWLRQRSERGLAERFRLRRFFAGWFFGVRFVLVAYRLLAWRTVRDAFPRWRTQCGTLSDRVGRCSRFVGRRSFYWRGILKFVFHRVARFPAVAAPLRRLPRGLLP